METTQISNSMSFGHSHLIAQTKQTWQNNNYEFNSNWETNTIEIPHLNPPTSKGHLVERARKFILKNLTNPKFKVSDLANALAYSQRQLERLIKRYTGFSIIKFIREIRLEVAYNLLKSKKLCTVAEVRYHVGFDHASYFNRVFIERYNIRPTELLNS